MSIKASASITEQQDDFARRLVADGHYPSLRAVVQRGLELVRAEIECEEFEQAALRAFLEERAKSPSISHEEGCRRVEAMLKKKRRALGL
nr:type II toxin-antitoxin system ParD family antitoxin [uncultured Roseovarius sp.]